MKVVSRDLLDKWFGAYPVVMHTMYKAYSETIPGVTNKSRFESKLRKNSHIVNSDFESESRYIAAFYQQESLIVISVLYVFPKHRGKCYGRDIIEALQDEAKKMSFILQVAVEEGKNDLLGQYYEKMGFVTLNKITHDSDGTGYIDYFWAPHKITMKYLPELDQVIINKA